MVADGVVDEATTEVGAYEVALQAPNSPPATAPRRLSSVSQSFREHRHVMLTSSASPFRTTMTGVRGRNRCSTETSPMLIFLQNTSVQVVARISCSSVICAILYRNKFATL